MASHFYCVLLLVRLLVGAAFALSVNNTAPCTAQERFAEKSFTEAELQTLISTTPLGCFVTSTGATFRVFAPRATSVSLVLFDAANDERGRDVPMHRTQGSAPNGAWDGVWECTQAGVPQRFYGKFYGYRVDGPKGAQELFNPAIVVGDPYSRAVASSNSFPQHSKTLIAPPEYTTDYNWEGDKWVIPADHNKLVIYEAHVRDLTAHPSSGVSAKKRGTYAALLERGTAGGLDYLKRLGVNAVEFLPLHEFNNIEVPFKDSASLALTGQFNDYNPYERNHWGYMTSFYFAPESYYAEGSLRGAYCGADGRATKELKDVIKTLHKAGVAVILDVVYNHVSDFDYNPFKYIDKLYYFRTDSAGRFINTSYCGNDFKTERLMARRLIIESIRFWMTEYHVDGFRFDLATMIDRETCEEIRRAALTINPNVILIAEPWGGNKYDPAGFSDIGWAAWNDQIRNGVKGQNPHKDAKNGLGFIFGKHQGSNSQRSEQAFVSGTLREDSGLFVKKEHSVNYLESHDDETMGDFIRLALGDVTMQTVIRDLDKHATLTSKQLALGKLAAMYLCASQGPIMLHAGQEYARSKVITPMPASKTRSAVRDTNIGKIDRNSYNKDNETNYVNYRHAALNRDLVEYYRGLIALRKQFPSAFGGANKADIEFLPTGSDHAIAFRIRNATKAASDNASKHKQPISFIVALNGNPTQTLEIAPPKGIWKRIANEQGISSAKPATVTTKTIRVPPIAGTILAEYEE